MVPSIRCLATAASVRSVEVAGRLAVMCWLLGVATASYAQAPPVHYYHQGVMPPGAIGSQQLQRGGPLSGYYQPVEIKAPPGALVSLAVQGQFEPGQSAPRKVGLFVGAVYRLRVMNIRLAEGLEVFPTIEIIDRLFAPPDQQQRFAIPIDITEEDLRLALDGKFVTRVIYLEDPLQAMPTRDDPQSQRWFEAAPGQDPLAVADGLGRPVAILRLGGRLPDAGEMLEPGFCYGSPPFMILATSQTVTEELPQPVKPTPTPKVLNLPPPPDIQSGNQGGAVQ